MTRIFSRKSEDSSSEQLREFAFVQKRESELEAIMAFNKDFEKTVEVSAPQKKDEIEVKK